MACRVLLEFSDEASANGFVAHVSRENAVWVEGEANSIKALPARVLVKLEAKPPASRPESLRPRQSDIHPDDPLILDYNTLVGRLLQVANEGGWNPGSITHMRVFSCDLHRLHNFLPVEYRDAFRFAYEKIEWRNANLENEIPWLAEGYSGDTVPDSADPFALCPCHPGNDTVIDDSEEPEDYDPGDGILCAPCLFTEETAKKAITVIAGLAVCEEHLHVPHDTSLSQHIVRKR